MKNPSVIMAHMVAYYPNRQLSEEAGKSLIEGGASFLEIQFPFSDPTADGPRIQNACSHALGAGFTVRAGFELAGHFAGVSAVPIFIMTYGNIAYTVGIENFVRFAQDAGVRGLIIPDLCPPEDEGLFEAGEKFGVDIVPVAAPGMSGERISTLARLKPRYVYAALRKGVTGKETAIDEASAFITRLSPLRTKLFAGFGIKTREQVLALEDKVFGLVIGSLFVEIIDQCLEKGKKKFSIDLREKISYLCKGDE